MKISQVNIYGFGKWQDYSISLTEEKINVISGRNEAGKSTLNQFILFVLFGLPPKQREFSRPKTGGPLGGQLIIDTKTHGKVTVERLHDHRNGRAVCHLENGEEFGEDWLNGLLNGTNREVYESIFSFSAEDLMKLRHMTGKELGKVLLNIGLTGSDRIYQTEKWLEKEIEDRFKPKGKKPQINRQLELVEDLSRQLSLAEREQDEYHNLIESKQNLIKTIQETEKSYQQAQKERYSCEQVMKALPMISEYHQVKEKKSSFYVSENFPEEARSRYQQVKEVILPLESEQFMVEENKRESVEKREELQQERIATPIKEEAESLLEMQHDYERAVYDLEQSRKRSDVIDAQLDKEMQHMNLPIEEQELIEYSFPFYIEETWRELKEESKAIDQEDEQLNGIETDMKVDRQQVQQRMDALNERMISEEEARKYSSQIDEAYQTAASHHQSQGSRVKLQQRNLLLLSSLLFLGGGWVISSVLSRVDIGLGAILIGALLGLGAWWTQRTEKNTDQEDYEPTGGPGFSLEEARQRLQQFEKNKAEKTYLQDQWKQWNQEEIRLDEKRRHLLQRKRRLEAAIQEQESLYPFLTSLSIEYWDQLYHLLTQAKEKSLEKQRLNDEMRDHEKNIQHIFYQLDEFYRDRNWESTLKSISQKWEELRNWLGHQHYVQEQLKQINDRVEQYDQRLHEIRLQLHAYEQKREELFQQASVSTEEEFYLRVKEQEEAEENLNLLQRSEQQLRGMLSKVEQDAYQVWEQVPDESSLNMQLNHLKDRIQSLEKNRRDLQQGLSDTKSKLQQLENSEKHSELIHRFELEKAELQKQAAEWTRYQVALQMLDKTKQNYKEKYMPQVIERASIYFERLTQGSYTKILVTSDQGQMIMEQKNGQRYELQELSRGTKDQLYVALRLAVGVTMADTMRLPFILDDAFVHFDEQRMQVMLKILEELSHHHQILLFTWRNDLSSYIEHPSVHHLE